MRHVSNKSVLKTTFLVPIVFYQKFISPLFPASCRYTPTCSSYAIQAVQQHGIIVGSRLALKRIARCHPWGSHGYDPVPKILITKVKSKKLIARPEIFVNEMNQESS